MCVEQVILKVCSAPVYEVDDCMQQVHEILPSQAVHVKGSVHEERDCDPGKLLTSGRQRG